MNNWFLSRIPQIYFGAGSWHQLTPLVQSFGRHVLLVTGHHSFKQQPHFSTLLAQWQQAGIDYYHVRIEGEPSPQWVDHCVQQHAHLSIQVVVAIGGGSALDAAKAVAGLLRSQRSVMDFLEGVGAGFDYSGQEAIPFIAMPTTAGTGSEATKNAVLSQIGVNGFKKSFRHEQLMPRYALVDPSWMLSLSAQQIAFNGLDAITQLIEGYTSTQANEFTDALALSGLQKAFQALPIWFAQPTSLEAASDMAYAALLSGIVLAHAGLGAVHGLAAPLGAFFDAPHGALCGILLAETTAINIDRLAYDDNVSALERYAHVGRLLMQDPTLSDTSARLLLVEKLREWQALFALPGLSDFGVTPQDIKRIVQQSRGNSMKTNPIILDDHALSQVLMQCL